MMMGCCTVWVGAAAPLSFIRYRCCSAKKMDGLSGKFAEFRAIFLYTVYMVAEIWYNMINSLK